MAGEGAVREGLLEFVEGDELALIQLVQASRSYCQFVESCGDMSLGFDRWNDVKELALLGDLDMALVATNSSSRGYSLS